MLVNLNTEQTNNTPEQSNGVAQKADVKHETARVQKNCPAKSLASERTASQRTNSLENFGIVISDIRK